MKALLLANLAVVLAAQPGFTQTLYRSSSAARNPASYVIVPQARHFAAPAAGAVQVSEVNVRVEIVEQVATTTMDISLTNRGGSRLEAQLVVPVPDKAALRGFTFQGNAPEATAELLTKEEARRTYDRIVARTRDPALLEFVGCNLIQSSVFPVNARSGQKVRVIYEHLLTADGDRVDYLLPRTESIDYCVPWKISVKIKSKTPIGTVYSPSHRLDTTRLGDNSVTARLAEDAEREPGPFRLSYLLQHNGVTASLLAYPDPKVGGGYFLLLACVPAKPPESRTGDPVKLQKREVILVLDRSGSMAGEKLEQVKTAALQVIEVLEDGEAFNIIVYNEAVESFAPEPVIKNAEIMRAARAYIRSILVRGGTNLHDALVEALRMKPHKGFLPIVLFLTDGLPTIGQTSEKAIREVAAKGNPYERRVFTFGVGVDVNTPLLDKIALDTRATATFVLPKEDVEVKIGQVFKRLGGPVLAGPKLRVLDSDGDVAPGRVRDLSPETLPDLFDGDQFVLLGQYIGDQPLQFALTGDYFGKERTFKFRFTLDKASTRNGFVPRLWASRKIATLTDAIRDLGADSGLGDHITAANNPKVKELVDEIVRLSKEFGILTEYTAFLAREGTDLNRPAEILAEAARNFEMRAIGTRSGYGSVNQELNNGWMRSQSYLNTGNKFYDANLNQVQVGNVQQINDRAYFQRNGKWVDSALIGRETAAPDEVIEPGTARYRQLVDQLAAEGRQGAVALEGEKLMRFESKTVLVK